MFEEEKIKEINQAVLVGLNCPGLSPAENASEDSLEELAALLDTAGGTCLGTVLQNKNSPDPRTFIGEGKVEEVRELAGSLGADLVIFDNPLSPSQQLLHLSRLALADEGAGIGGVLVLEHGAHAHAPRSLQQIGQLLHGGVVGVFLGGQAVGVQAHQHRPVFRLLCLVFRHTVLRAAGRSPGVSFSSVLPQSPQ